MQESNKIDKRSKEYRLLKTEQVISNTVLDTIIENAGSEVTTVSNQILSPQIFTKEPQINNMSDIQSIPEVANVATPTSIMRSGTDSPVKVRGIVSIKAYVSGEPNMGHEKYEEALFPGTEQFGTVFCIKQNNINTYRTGLNEFAPEVQNLDNKNEREAKIRYIREVVAWLENVANANFKVSPTNCMDGFGTRDDKFWDNVTMFQSVCVDTYDPKGNRVLTYWDRLSIVLTNEGRTLNLKDPHDVALYHVVMADGIGLISSSLQKAIDEYPAYNFYLNKVEDTATIKTEFKIQKNKAAGYLEIMRETNPVKLFYMAIMCTPTGAALYQIGGETATPILQLYDDLCNYLDGKTVETSQRIATANFLKYYGMEDSELNVRSILKCATELNLVTIRQNGQMYYVKNGGAMGKNVEDMVVNLQSAQHQETWESMRDTIKSHWRK